jgi:hypothetical protein
MHAAYASRHRRELGAHELLGGVDLYLRDHLVRVEAERVEVEAWPASVAVSDRAATGGSVRLAGLPVPGLPGRLAESTEPGRRGSACM